MEAPLEAVNNIVTGKTVTVQRFRCRFHAKEGHYQITFYDKDFLLVVKCLECTPPMEIVRFKVEKMDAPMGQDHEAWKARWMRRLGGS